MAKCEGCGKEASFDIVDGYCVDCIAKMEAELDDAVERGPSEAVEKLVAFSKKYKVRLAEYRAYLAELGYECTYKELQDILNDMDDAGVKITRESVPEFIKRSRG